MGRLTDTQLKAWLRAGNPIAGKSDGDGLTFTLSPAGTAAWVLRYRYRGRTREYCIGKYPDTSLAYARELAIGLRGRIQKGEDIAATRRAEKAREKLPAATCKDLFNDWLSRTLTIRHGVKVRRTFQKYAQSAIGALAPEEVRPMHIDHILRGTAEIAPTTANDLLGYLKRMFAYAKKRHIVDDNPALDFDYSDAGGKECARSRALSRSEIHDFLVAMRNCQNLGRDNELAFRLLLLLGVRKSELVCAEWLELDLDNGLWHLPASRNKTNSAITIPLSATALTLYEELQVRAAGSRWVFPARRIGSRERGHISPDTLNVALSRVQHGIDHFTIHDLRRTVRTQLAAMGVAPHIAERVLNHKLRGMAGVYDRYDYLPERREALNRWADVLNKIEAGKPVDNLNVVPLRRAFDSTSTA